MGSYGGSAWYPSEGGGGAWIPSDGSPGVWFPPDDGGGSHGKASHDPAAMPPYYGPPVSIPAMGPDSDLFWSHPYFGRVWDDGDDDGDGGSDDPEKQPIECEICNRESNHTTLDCPFMVLTRQDVLMRTPQVTSQLDFIMRTPRAEVRFNYYHMEDDEYIGGSGLAFDRPPGQRNVECCAADAMMLHKDGINMVRITGLPRVVAEPELVYQLFVKIGPVTNVVVFPDHDLAFVNFVSEEAAQTAIKRFTGSGFGCIMWATQKPY